MLGDCIDHRPRASQHWFVQALFSFASCCNAVYAVAEQSQGWLEFQSTNIQMLHGKGFEVGARERQILTLEHANRWRYGDFYGFVDHTLTDKIGTYAEITPRFSLSKLGIVDIKNKIFDDVFIATSVEFGKGGLRRYLYGLGANPKIPGFVYVKLNGYQRDDPDLRGKTYQATLTWAKRFGLFNLDFVFEGFVDIAGSEGPAKAYQLVVPRLLVDLGPVLNLPDKSLYVGIEYQYWHNKFGIDGLTESVPQLQLKLML